MIEIFERIISRYRKEAPAIYAVYKQLSEKPDGLGAFDFSQIWNAGQVAAGPATTTNFPGITSGSTIGTTVAAGDWRGALASLIDAVPTYFLTKEQAKQQQDQAKIIALQELQRGQLQLQQEAQIAQSQLEAARIMAEADANAQAANEIAGIGDSKIPWVIIGGVVLAYAAYAGSK